MDATVTKTVREFAAEVPNATRVFEKFGIDYCCGGSKPLQAACRQVNISFDEVMRSLEEASLASASPKTAVSFQNAGLGELIAHILTVHHGYVKTEVPRIIGNLPRRPSRDRSGRRHHLRGDSPRLHRPLSVH